MASSEVDGRGGPGVLPHRPVDVPPGDLEEPGLGCHDNEGKLLDPDEFLEALDFDWTDISLLPYDPERSAPRNVDPNAKAERPQEKQGIIGAFCRAYDVPAAIDEFLSDVYEEGDHAGSQTRYTYLEGSGANGAIVYDDGDFLYSQHGTDPVSDRLVNAFDLVRIHKFGHLDDGVREGNSPTNLPSYRAMVELAERDNAVMEEVGAGLAERFEFDDDEDEDDPEGTPSADEIETAGAPTTTPNRPSRRCSRRSRRTPRKTSLRRSRRSPIWTGSRTWT